MVNCLVAMALGTRWTGSWLASAAARVVSTQARRDEETAGASSTK